MSDFVLVLTTFSADGNAEQFAARLIEERLAACVNILPSMRSIYRWKNVVESADERQLIIKTAAECVPALEALVATMHPYEVPEFLVIPVTGGDPDYLAWLTETVAPSSPQAPKPRSPQ